MLVIYLGTASPLSSIVLPSGSGGQPSLLFAGLHELSTPGVHSTDITAGLVGVLLVEKTIDPQPKCSPLTWFVRTAKASYRPG